jgi:cytochrome c-type biogenesis protein CcmH
MTVEWVRVAFFVLFASAATTSFAVQPDEVMKDPALETRARTLSAELRCMVCQNQSIDDSDAPLARDIRVLIRQRLADGQSNDAIRGYLVSRYGDFILLKPRLKPETLLLWFGPPLILCAGLAAAFRARLRVPVATRPLSEQEERELAAMIGDR